MTPKHEDTAQSVGFTIYRVFALRGGVTLGVMVLVTLWGASICAQTPAPKTERRITPAMAYGKLPIYFEKNMGQAADPVKFLSRGSGYGLFLTPTEAVLDLRSRTGASRDIMGPTRGLNFTDPKTRIAPDLKRSVVRMKFLGAKDATHVTGVDQADAKVNYFIGNDSRKWLTAVPTFAKVQYSGIYPGVDVVYYGNQGRLEYDLQLEPNADPGVIRLGVEGAQQLSLTKSGDLMMVTEAGTLVLQKPVMYQLDGVARKRIKGGYVLRGPHELGVQVAPYDKNKALVVDPVLIYSSYLGGTGQEMAFAGTVDAQGNAYVGGWTNSIDFPATKTLGPVTTDGSQVAFISKVNASGTGLIYSTYLSGGNNTSTDQITGIAVDANGYAYVTGETNSASFPVTATAYQSGSFQSAPRTVFVSKLSADGQSLLYSTYLGGGGDQWAEPIAVDAHQVTYIGGSITPGTPAFPTTANAFQTTNRSPNGNAFVSKIDTTLSGASSLVYSTFLGGSTGNGSNGDAVVGLVVDSSARVYVTGFTLCTDFPVTATAYQSTSKAQFKMTTSILSQIDTTKSGTASLLYSTYLGGSAPANSGRLGDAGGAVTLDLTGKVYVSGLTMSADFPITVGTAPIGSMTQGFVAKFDLTKSNVASLSYSRVFGNNLYGTSTANAIAVDPAGDTYVGGNTTNPNFPVTADAVQSNLKSTAGNGFLTIFSSDASTILYSTFFGSSGGTSSEFVSTTALDPAGNIYISGFTYGIDLPTTQQTLQPTLQGTSDGFIAKFGGISTPTITNLSATSGLVGAPITVSGLNFGSSGTVTFNGVAATPTSWTTTSIVVPVPAGAAPGNVVVTAGGLASNGMAFTVLSGTVPIVLVQHARKAAGTTTSAPLAFPSNNSAGNWIGVCVRAGGTSQNLSVSDSNGNLYLQALSVNETGGGNTLAIFYAENVASGPNTVTVSDTASSSLELIVLEYSGVALYGSLDKVVSAIGNSLSPNSGTTTTTANGDLLLGEIISASSGTITAGSGFIAEELVPPAPTTQLMGEDQSLSQAGNAVATATLSASGFWAAGLAAFKPGTSTTGTAPTITSLTPVTGGSGTVVTISGYNFGVTQGTVKFNTTTASPSSWTPSAITVAAPAGVTDGYVVVTVNGVASNGVWFAQPFISSTSPTSGAVGATVTINGSHFGATIGAVRFNGISVTPSSWAVNKVVVPVPAGATTGPIVVANSNGIVSNEANFSVTGAVPSVTGLSPSLGAVGTTVTINGANFGTPQGASTVKFNGVLAGTASQWSTTQIKIPVPSGATTGNVVVTVGGQSDLQTRIFTVPGTASISGMSPSRGGIGAAVSITGSNLGTSGTIKFNGVTATPWSWTWTLIVVPVPSGATDGTVTVTAGGIQMSAGVFAVRSTIPSTATEFSYDAMGRVIQKTVCTPMNCGTEQAPLNLSATYDFAGNETSVSFNGPTIQYGIDGAGRITQVTSTWVDSQHPATLATADATNGYWPTGALRKATLANGLTESSVYNKRSQPCRINVNSSGTLLSTCADALPPGNVQDLRVNLNAGTSDNGNVAALAASGQQNFNRSYAYDGLNRIRTMSAPGDQCSGLSWTIDPWGNRTAQTTTGGSCFSPAAAVDTTNRLTGYQYDLAGNLLNDGTHAYAYDAEERLTTVDGGTTASYIYDAFGKRVAKNVGGGTSEYVYDQDGKLNTVFANGSFQRAYVYIGGMPLAEYFQNTTYFVHTDHLGSTRLLTGLDKSVQESDDYYPYGELIPPTGGTVNIEKFTGKERDSESGLDNFGKRYHASTMGRFMTPDPIGIMKQKLRDPQQWNMYSYARNNPLRFTDPTGMYNTDCKTALGKCSKEIQNFEATRKKDLQSKDPAVRLAAAAYGSFNDGNKVNVKFDPNAKEMNSAVQDRDANGNGKDSITVTFRTMDKTAEDVPQQAKVAHEGSHVMDFQDVMAGGKPMTLYQTEKTAFRRSMGVLLDSNDVMDAGGQLFIPPTSPIQKGWNEQSAEKVLADPMYGLTEEDQGGYPYVKP